MGQVNDKVVIELQNILACKKEEIRPIKPIYKTNMQFRFHPGGPVINLHTVSDINVLVGMGSTLLREKYFFSEAVEKFGTIVAQAEFKWETFPINDWLSDIETKLMIINYQKKKAEYEALERRLAALESDDLKTTKELEAIMALLNK